MAVSTLLIEGTFPELAEELAQYFDSIEDNGLAGELESSLTQLRENPDNTADNASIQDEILKKIVSKATVLNNASERGKECSLASMHSTDT